MIKVLKICGIYALMLVYTYTTIINMLLLWITILHTLHLTLQFLFRHFLNDTSETIIFLSSVYSGWFFFVVLTHGYRWLSYVFDRSTNSISFRSTFNETHPADKFHGRKELRPIDRGRILYFSLRRARARSITQIRWLIFFVT